MAQAQFEDFAPRRSILGAFSTGRIINLAAALSSAGLLVGASVWAYQIAVRDISGVPVIRALEQPMRIMPDDPGGQIATYTGLAVNDVVADLPDGPAQTAVRRAPPPLTLAPEDAPGLGLVAAPQGSFDAPDRSTAPQAEDLVAAVLPPVADAAPDVMTPASSATIAPTATAPQGASGVTRSLRPPPRPRTLASAPTRAPTPTSTQATPRAIAAGGSNDPVAAALASALASIAPLTQSDVREIDPAQIASGTRLVQLGTFDDPAAARAGWDAVAARAGTLMVGKARVIEAAQVGGQSFYRLRVQGFDSEDASRRFCAAVEAPGTRCVPVTHR
jgi:hypothetical protein